MFLYYLQLVIGIILGQTFVAAMISWYYQRSNPKITYPKAFKLYIAKEQGTFAVIISFSLMVLFVLSEWLDLSLSKQELVEKDKLTRVETIQRYFKTYSAVYGSMVQFIAFLFFKGGRNAVKNYGKNIGVDILEMENTSHLNDSNERSG